MKIMIAAAVATMMAAAPLAARSPIDVPVFAGGEPDSDACPSTGDVVGLNPRGEGFLSVRSGPGGKPFREIDRIYNGQHVYICEQRGVWLGVVYAKRDDGIGCRVRRPWAVRAPYTGPCRSGWVHERYVGNLAG
jgi:hypothetical protein